MFLTTVKWIEIWPEAKSWSQPSRSTWLRDGFLRVLLNFIAIKDFNFRFGASHSRTALLRVPNVNCEPNRPNQLLEVLLHSLFGFGRFASAFDLALLLSRFVVGPAPALSFLPLSFRRGGVFDLGTMAQKYPSPFAIQLA